MIYVQDADLTLHHGDVRQVLATLPAGSVDCVITSPPYYGLRDYGTGSWDGGDADCDHATPIKQARPSSRLRNDGRAHVGPYDGEKSTLVETAPYRDVCGKCGARRTDNQIGLEPTLDAYITEMVAVFREVRRVVADHATVWCNMGDSFQDKQLLGVPWKLAFALQDDGWYLRSDIIWSKPNQMPESVTDRPTKAHEYVFLLTKRPRYWFDQEAVREDAAWERWGDQTNGKHQGSGSAASWIKPQSKDALTARSNKPGWSGNPNVHGEKGHPLPGAWTTSGGGRNVRSVWNIATQPFSARALFGDEERITSPDCPVHGDHPVRAATASHGGRVDAPSSHTQRTDDGRAQEPLGDSAPTDPRPAPTTADESSDSPDLSPVPAATPHSTGSRRTDPVLATTEPCTPSAQTLAHIGDTSEAHESGVLFSHIPESSNGLADSVARLSARTPSRSADRSSCTCKYIDHFATFPEELVRRCLLAGCPEWVCSDCGAPWERVVERGESDYARLRREQGHGWTDMDAAALQRGVILKEGEGGQTRNANGTVPSLRAAARTDHGFAPSCTCSHVPEVLDDDVVAEPLQGSLPVLRPHLHSRRPGVVLDPFVGSGTTAHVARKHGRACVGIDLNAEYLELAARRTAQLSLLAEEAHG